MLIKSRSTASAKLAANALHLQTQTNPQYNVPWVHPDKRTDGRYQVHYLDNEES